MKYFVILTIIVVSLLYSNLPDAEARTVAPLSIFLEDATIKQNSFITADGGVPDITIQKGETVSFPLKVSSRGLEPLSVNFFHNIELAIPDTHQATLPDMKIELDPFHMVLKPDEPQIMNVTITTLNYTQLGEHKIRLTAQYPQGDALLSTRFDVLVVGETPYENPNNSKYPVPGGGIISDIYPIKKQFEIGIKFENLKCDKDYVLIQKYDGSPACVTESTKLKLIERGWTAKNDSTLSKINTSCMTLEQSKETAPFFKTPSYLPEGYSYVCSRSGMPFESYIVYYNQEFPTNWQIPELVSEGAIFIYQIDELNHVGEKEYAIFGSPEQRTRETYDSVIEGNPSLNPQLITINGMLAYAVDSCPDCGTQTANFTDGTSIQKSTSSETRIKFIDENGVSYMLETTLPLSELIKVAESLQ